MGCLERIIVMTQRLRLNAKSLHDPGTPFSAVPATDPRSGVCQGDPRMRYWRSPDVTVPGDPLPKTGKTVRSGSHLGPKTEFGR